MRLRCGNRTIAAVAAVITAVTVASCFTGIESTPKITGADVKRDRIASNPDVSYLDAAVAEKIGDWKPGKAFVVTDSRISLAMAVSGEEREGERGEEREGERGKRGEGFLTAGDTIYFAGARDVNSMLGKPVAEIRFTGRDGVEAVFNAEASMGELGEMDGVKIPFTVELSRVEKVRNMVTGKKYFILTSDWNDMNRQPRRGRRYVEVETVDVQPGNDTYPVCLTLVQQTDTFTVMLSLGNGIADTRKFSTLFSTRNPRVLYPKISDANWALIQNGRVAEGMTREEVRMSVGNPKNVERRPGYSVLSEIWTYPNGSFMIFEDGLLKSFRL